jgi:methylmalonyl-CoA mutase N-terminal domain/subunit
MGGTLKALENGFFHQDIDVAAVQWQTEVESGKRIIVGVNKFTIPEEERVERLALNPALRAEQNAP